MIFRNIGNLIKRFTPKINQNLRKELINGWLKTVNKTINQNQ